MGEVLEIQRQIQLDHQIRTFPLVSAPSRGDIYRVTLGKNHVDYYIPLSLYRLYLMNLAAIFFSLLVGAIGEYLRRHVKNGGKKSNGSPV